MWLKRIKVKVEIFEVWIGGTAFCEFYNACLDYKMGEVCRMLTKVKALIDRSKMLSAGDKIVVACSGGPDSLALLHIFNGFCLEYNISVFAAHLDHMFRGLESAAEADFVVDFCQQHGIPCFHTAIDVPKFIKESGLSGSDAARVVRYQYLQSVTEKLGGAKIATGHHRDDQAETVLLHILRGAGSVGIRGIQPINHNIIRPLLSVTRAEITAYCETYHLEPRFDSSNLKTNYLRNRIRIDLLPELEKKFNVAIKDALCRSATIVGDEHDFIQTTANEIWSEVTAEQSEGIVMIAAKIKSIHIAVKREIIRMAIEKTQGSLVGISFDHVETVLELLSNGTVGSVVQLPAGLVACKSYDGLYISRHTPVPPQIHYAGQELAVPGITMITELGISLTTEIIEQVNCTAQPCVGIFDWLALSTPLFVRIRRDGDRFQPLGFTGTKKLKKFFIDLKVPRQVRDSTPIICDRNDIIWVAGYRQSEVGKITDDTKKILKITINKIKQKTMK